MKIFTVLLILLVPFIAFAENGVTDANEEESPMVPHCPTTLITDNSKCGSCHEVQRVDEKFVYGIKEEAWRDAPYGVEVVKDEGEEVVYYLVENIDSDAIRRVYEFARKYNLKRVFLEINSPGGSVIEAWRIVGMMQKYPEIHTTTSVLGMAASAGFILLSSGDHRIANPRSMNLCHELWSLSFLKIETPSKSKDEAEIMELWQTNINEWLAERSNMTKEEISEKIHHRDWWMTGKTAHELGFVDELVWK